ncbi:hypothetical protein T439DRAFT_324392 [Meredithblackwellia eburnea MCA 4105]
MGFFRKTSTHSTNSDETTTPHFVAGSSPTATSPSTSFKASRILKRGSWQSASQSSLVMPAKDKSSRRSPPTISVPSPGLLSPLPEKLMSPYETYSTYTPEPLSSPTFSIYSNASTLTPSIPTTPSMSGSPRVHRIKRKPVPRMLSIHLAADIQIEGLGAINLDGTPLPYESQPHKDSAGSVMFINSFSSRTPKSPAAASVYDVGPTEEVVVPPPVGLPSSPRMDENEEDFIGGQFSDTTRERLFSIPTFPSSPTASRECSFSSVSESTSGGSVSSSTIDLSESILTTKSELSSTFGSLPGLFPFVPSLRKVSLSAMPGVPSSPRSSECSSEDEGEGSDGYVDSSCSTLPTSMEDEKRSRRTASIYSVASILKPTRMVVNGKTLFITARGDEGAPPSPPLGYTEEAEEEDDDVLVIKMPSSA